MTAASGPSRGALIAGFATIYLVWGSTYLGIRVADRKSTRLNSSHRL